MSDPNHPATPPGWYPDGQGNQRYWDGAGWTEHVQPQQPAQPQQPPVGQQWQQPGVAGHPYAGGPGGTSGGGNGKLIAIIGGGVGALVLVIILAVVLFATLGGNDPESVAKDYIEESLRANVHVDGDHEKLCEMRTEDAREALLEGFEVDDCGEYAEKREEAEADDREARAEDCADWEELTGDIGWEVEIVEVDENDDGDEATVEFEISYSFDGDEDKLEDCDGDADEFDETEDGELTLVEQDGDWKVED